MSAVSCVKSLYFSYFSKPVNERVLYRSLRGHEVKKILEIGMGDLRRADRLIAMAGWHRGAGDVSYTGIDLFEARPLSQERLSLKQAHQRLARSEAKIKLVPGDPFEALARAANGLMGMDLVVISGDVDMASLDRAWFYVPRLLHERSVVLWEQCEASSQDAGAYHKMLHSEIATLATGKGGYRAA